MLARPCEVPAGADFEICVNFNYEGADPTDQTTTPQIECATLLWLDSPPLKTDATLTLREIRELAPAIAIAVTSHVTTDNGDNVRRFVELGESLRAVGGVALLRQAAKICVAERLRGSVASMWRC